MLDPIFLRDHMDEVRRGLRHRGLDPDKALEDIAALEIERRQLILEVEGLKRQQNTAGDDIAKAKRQGLDTAAIQEASRARAQQIKQLDTRLEAIEHQRNQALLQLPNLPHASVPVGASSADNVEVRRHGVPRQFDFDPVPHWDLGPALGIIDFERGTRLSGRPLHGLERRGRASLTRPDQLHARPAHARARVSGGRAAVPGQQRVAARNRQPAQVRGGSVQDRGRLGPLSDPDGRSAADESSPWRDSRRPQAARSATRPTRRVSAARRARTARTCAA